MEVRFTAMIVTMVSLAWGCQPAALAIQEAPAPEAPPASTESDSAASRLVPGPRPTHENLTIELAPLDGIADEAEYRRVIAQRAGEFAQQAEQADDKALAVEMLLVAANQVLAYELEPVCTRRLLFLLPEGQAEEEAVSAESLRRVDEWLARAETILETLAARDSAPTERSVAAQGKLSALRAFSHALRAYLLPQSQLAGARSARQAASAIAILLEDDRPGVAVAAALWQSLLREKEEDPTPALDVLPLVLSEHRREALPFSFFGRLQRCRVLAAHGKHAVALALLTQLEERSSSWFSGESERADAARTIAAVQVEVLREWHAALAESRDEPARVWCKERLEKLAEQYFGGERRTVMRLSPAVPLVAAVEALRHHTPQSPEPAAEE